MRTDVRLIEGEDVFLYLICQNQVRGWDTFQGAVVAAVSAEQAREIHPRDGDLWADREERNWNSWNRSWNSGWASDPSHVEARLLGHAEPGIEAGEVILTDFNAG